jgi:membrane-bound metal-dependent hydrolase YbcI (DUF457 family)
LSGRHFSLMVFGFSQVAMDIEPLVRIIRGDALLHGFTHTYAGASLIALVSVAVGRPVCQFFLNYWIAGRDAAFLSWLRGPKLISWPAALAGAFVGTYGHVLLDSIMHSDMRPLAPLSDANGLLHVISVEGLHLLCLLGGILGFMLMLVLLLIGRRARVGSRNA